MEVLIDILLSYSFQRLIQFSSVTSKRGFSLIISLMGSLGVLGLCFLRFTSNWNMNTLRHHRAVVRLDTFTSIFVNRGELHRSKTMQWNPNGRQEGTLGWRNYGKSFVRREYLWRSTNQNTPRRCFHPTVPSASLGELATFYNERFSPWILLSILKAMMSERRIVLEVAFFSPAITPFPTQPPFISVLRHSQIHRRGMAIKVEAASDCSVPASPHRQAETMCSDRLGWMKWTAPAWFGSVVRTVCETIGSLDSLVLEILIQLLLVALFQTEKACVLVLSCRSMYPTSDQRYITSISAFEQPRSRAMWCSSPILRLRRSSCFLGFSVFSKIFSSLCWDLLVSLCLDMDCSDIAARHWLFLFKSEESRTERRVDERVSCLENRDTLRRRYLCADCRSRYRASCSFAISFSIHSSFSASPFRTSHWYTDRWGSTTFDTRDPPSSSQHLIRYW